MAAAAPDISSLDKASQVGRNKAGGKTSFLLCFSSFHQGANVSQAPRTSDYQLVHITTNKAYGLGSILLGQYHEY